MNRLFTAFIAGLLLAACSSTEPVEEEPLLLPLLDDSEAERCISLSRVASTRVLDSSTIEFRMRGGETYINILPRRCPGLRAGQPFMYKTSQSVLCNLDLISVLDTSGFGYRPMGSCGLGMFRPTLMGGNGAIVGDEPDS